MNKFQVGILTVALTASAAFAEVVSNTGNYVEARDGFSDTYGAPIADPLSTGGSWDTANSGGSWDTANYPQQNTEWVTTAYAQPQPQPNYSGYSLQGTPHTGIGFGLNGFLGNILYAVIALSAITALVGLAQKIWASGNY